MTNPRNRADDFLAAPGSEVRGAPTGGVDIGDLGDVRDVAGNLPLTDASIAVAPYTYRGLVSVAEYRELTSDHASADAIIVARLEYLEALFRNLIRAKLESLFPRPK
jgi:hypothetical protein